MKKIIIIFCVSALFLTSMPSVFALSDTELQSIRSDLYEQVSTYPIDLCRDTLVPTFDLELMEFLKFIEGHFQSKNSTTSLINVAIARYGSFKVLMKQLVDSLSPVNTSNDSNYQLQFSSYSDCLSIMNAYTAAGKKYMLDHIRQTAAAKQTTVLTEKYNALNDKLKILNSKFAEMFGNFTSMESRMPQKAFIRECVES